MTHIRTISELVHFFGGDTVLATKLGISQSTVAHWKKRQRIAAGWHLRLIAEIAQNGATVEPSVFGLDHDAGPALALPAPFSSVFRRGAPEHSGHAA